MMGAMDDLVQFLTACLDDEQRAAEDALKRTTTTRRMIQGQWVEDTIQPPEWRRSAWSPARVLREVDAKRQIAEQHDRFPQPQMMAMGQIWACGTCGSVDDSPTEWPCATLRLLALPYADHPEYRDEWRP